MVDITKTLRSLFVIMAIAGYSVTAQAQIIITFAGGGPGGLGDGGAATAATFNNPATIAVDAPGNVYVADMGNNRVRKIDVSGIITTIAGGGAGGDGIPATAAILHQPNGVCVDGPGNLYITEMASSGGNKVRKVNTAGIISTIAGTGLPGFSGDGAAATLARLNMPSGVAADGAGNIYIADWGNNRVRKINTSGIISTIAGGGTLLGDGGPATLAQLNNPYSVSPDIFGNLFISDELGYRLRKVNTAGIISTVAGTGVAGSTGDGGPATAALFNQPDGIVADAGSLYIADYSNNRIRRVDLSTGIVTGSAGTGVAGFGGDGSAATAAMLNGPSGVALDVQGNVYISDFVNNRIRRINVNNRVPSFTGGHLQFLTICENAAPVPVNSLLAVQDTDVAQTERWTLFSTPLHGSAIVTYTTTSTGGVLTPSGLSYTPTTGYWGKDTFRVKVDDRISIDTTTIVVTINPLPAPGAIRGASSVCRGASITLSDDTTGGAWSASNSTATVMAGIVSGVSAGRDTISYSVTNACGTTTVTKTVTIDTITSAGVITGPTDVCIGSTMTLTDAASGGVWRSSNTAAASVTGGVVTGSSAGVDTISYTVANSCGSSTAIHLITISVPPVTNPITGTVREFCAGTSITLGETSPGGVWGSLRHKVAISGPGIITGVSGGIDTVTYTITNACGTAMSSYSVSILPLPNAGSILGLNYVCPGHTVVLGNFAPGGTWSSSNTAICTISGSGGVVTGLLPGIATISYTVSNSCGTSVARYTMTVLSGASCYNGVKVNTIAGADDAPNIFPNPARGAFTILLPASFGASIICITDVVGKIIETRATSQKENYIYLPGIAPGTYIVKLQGDHAVYNGKIEIY
jgi:hypothetical protein